MFFITHQVGSIFQLLDNFHFIRSLRVFICFHSYFELSSSFDRFLAPWILLKFSGLIFLFFSSFLLTSPKSGHLARDYVGRGAPFLVLCPWSVERVNILLQAKRG